MDPQDDPEARIRELERPLTESARISEMGAGQPTGYPYPPAPAPTYGAAFPPTSPRRTTGFPWWWIVLAALVVGAVAVAAAIAVFGAHLFSSGFSSGSSIIRPSISRGNGPSIPGNLPGPSSSATQPPGLGGSTPPPGSKLSFAGIGLHKTIVCNDSFVRISGFTNTVVITGHCARVTVSGGQNIVTVDATDTIEASGFNNQVTYHAGSPSVDNSGESNIVQQG